MRFKIHTKGVIVGVITEVVTSLVMGFIFGLIEPQLHRGAPLTGDPLHIVSLTIGFFSTLLAAYLTARMSPTDKFANVAIFWAVNEVLGLLSLFVVTFPFWYNVTGMFTVLIASVLGWYIERITRPTA
jgi:hypothetical protein